MPLPAEPAIADRVFERAIFVGGTGAVSLTVSAVLGYQTFLAGWGASRTGWYCLVVGSQWETGEGTLNAGGTTLTRTTVFHGSSGTGVLVNFSAGTMDCFGDLPAARIPRANVLWVNDPPFNAAADGVTDDLAAFNAAIAAGIAQGRAVSFRGLCYLSDSFTINDSVDFGGTFTGYGHSIPQGHGTLTTGSLLKFASARHGVIVDTPKPVKLHDFVVFPVVDSVLGSGYSGVYVTDTGGYINQNSIFDNVFIIGYDYNFNFERAATWFMTRCNTLSGHYGLRCRDVLNGDGGDIICEGNVFAQMSKSGVLYESAGGFKFIGNKTNGGEIGFEMNMTSNANTGQLEIVSNSFDGCNSGIVLRRAAGVTTGYNAAEIVGNFILAANGDGISVPTNAGGSWLSGLSITGNSINLGTANSSCIAIDSTTGVTIDCNVFLTGSANCYAILLGSAVSNATIGLNSRFGVAFNPDAIAAGAIDPFSMPFGGGLALVDGITAPATKSGYAQIYVDTSDGDLKIKFGDGTVKTIVTD